MSQGNIRAGIGGWTYEPWRGVFYPADLPQARELEYASRQVTAIEVNGTYYGNQKPSSFARWRDETPDDFVFSLKATRYATNRRVLAEAGESVQRFIDSGIAELGSKLGPIVWQFAPSKVFDPDDFEAFLALLPGHAGEFALRHVMDVRHPTFMDAAYLELARKYGAATVFTDSEKYPSFADLTGDFVYARLMRASPESRAGYTPKALQAWAQRAVLWASGGEPEGLPRVCEPTAAAKPARPAAAAKAAGSSRDVFMFFINGAKEKAPAAAQALLKQLAR